MGRENQGRCAVSCSDDLDVHAVFLVLLRVVRLIRVDSVGGNQRSVNDDVVALTEAGEGFVQAGSPGGQDVPGLVDVAPGSALGYAETGAELGERLVLTQVDQGEKSLLEATEPAPTSLACATVLVQQPGNMLDELAEDVQHGWAVLRPWDRGALPVPTSGAAPNK